MSSSSLSSVQDVSERAAWGVLVCEPQHREADPGGPNHPGGPRVSSLLQRAAGGSRATHPADAVNLQPAAGAWHRPPPLSKAGRARRALAWWVEGGFSRSSDTCIYIWKETSTELSTPPRPPNPPTPRLPPPQLEMPAPSLLESLLGRKRVVAVRSWGKGLGEGKKKFLFLNPCVSFA